ncbi:PAAR domain-containing protein [Achromobacter spanius]|uniref:PAAR domain-containing protein n=1 Tax=Achromobacter spanius TaxID=217203 RepID=UPI003D6623DA
MLDKPLATEGDKIACGSCQSMGSIVCIGPRIPEYYEGRQVALEGDLCACRCPGPPRLIPSQRVRFQNIEGSYATAVGGSFGGIPAFASPASSSKKPMNRRGMSFVERSAAKLRGWPSRIFMPGDLKEMLEASDIKQPYRVQSHGSSP